MNKFMYISYMNMELQLQLHVVCSHTFISLQQSIHCIHLLTNMFLQIITWINIRP